jgi:hypothetical protein
MQCVKVAHSLSIVARYFPIFLSLTRSTYTYHSRAQMYDEYSDFDVFMQMMKETKAKVDREAMYKHK